MAAGEVTFGWVVAPSTPAAGAAARGGAMGLTHALLENDRAFVAALPPQFDTLWLEDHFQWGENPTLEAWTTATYFAALYPTMRVGNLVLGQSYRNPALTAKMATTLQALTGGRLILGIGAGWKQDEYEAYGYPYPNPATRIAELEEAIHIIRTMWSDSPATYTGRHYHVTSAYCEPRPNPAIPLLIGGSGERKTLAVVARHADLWNGAFQTPEVYAHKQAVLAEHCRAIGRDPASIIHTYYGFIDLSDAQETAARSPVPHVLNGSPSQVAAELRQFIAQGVRHVMIRFTDFPATTGLERFSREVLPALDL